MIRKLIAAALLALVAAPLFSFNHIPRLEARLAAAAGAVQTPSLVRLEPLLPGSLF